MEDNRTISDQELVGTFEAADPAPKALAASGRKPRVHRYAKGETYDLHIWLGLSRTYATRKARHAGEDLALIDLMNVLEAAARDKVPASATVQDEEHVMYVGHVRAETNFAVEYGIPKR